MNNKQIDFGKDTRAKLYKGVETLANAVKATMGPRGRNVLIERDGLTPHITKDGVTVAREIQLSDNTENMGVKLVQEAAINTVNIAGDGTTTATVLTHAIFKEGLKHITVGSNPIKIKRDMDKLTDEILEELGKMTKICTSTEDILKVATLSANGDNVIGKIITDAYGKIGKYGSVSIIETKGSKDELVFLEGMSIQSGLLSNYYINNKTGYGVDNPLMLITDQKIDNVNTILPILTEVKNSNKPLVIIADDFDDSVLNVLIENYTKGALNVVCLKAPGYGDRKKDYLEDICVTTGATLITKDLGYDLNNLKMEDLGTCLSLSISKKETDIIGGAGDSGKIVERIERLKDLLPTVTNEFDIEKMEERISKLSGGAVIIKVGGTTELEMKERKDRYDDAVSAVRVAINDGVVIGGGCALVQAGNAVDKLISNGSKSIGQDILLKAIQMPFKTIIKNAGFKPKKILKKVLPLEDVKLGFDSKSGEVVDMFEVGIVDPVLVTKTALKNAVSLASLLLTTEVGITNEGAVYTNTGF